MVCDKNHGSPYDRGGADSYYGRPPVPHKILDFERITTLTSDEIEEYWLGYYDNEEAGDFKDWGTE